MVLTWDRMLTETDPKLTETDPNGPFACAEHPEGRREGVVAGAGATAPHAPFPHVCARPGPPGGPDAHRIRAGAPPHGGARGGDSEGGDPLAAVHLRPAAGSH
eukprot:6376346-Pyramimonas_sp.AAC.1